MKSAVELAMYEIKTLDGVNNGGNNKGGAFQGDPTTEAALRARIDALNHAAMKKDAAIRALEAEGGVMYCTVLILILLIYLFSRKVALGFTSTMMTQTYSGTTTIVPQVCLRDFIQLFGDQTLEDMNRYFQGGSVAAYQHVQMMRLHYRYVSIDDMFSWRIIILTPIK